MLKYFTTGWQRLEIGIMAGCRISPLVVTMEMEVIIRASKWVVGGETAGWDASYSRLGLHG